MNRYMNLDAAQSVFFDKQLEYIRSNIFEYKYPALKGRLYLPVDSSAGDGIDTITSRQEDSVGQAKVITDYAADLPRADVYTGEVNYPVRDLGISFGYSIREIRAAARAGVDLSGKKARAARKGAEQSLDVIAATGDATAGLPGFINNALITPANVANPGGGTAWTAKTPDQIIADLNEGVSTMRNATNGIHGDALTVLLPEAQYTLLAQTRMTDLDTTLLKFFLGTSPFVKEILPWWRLDGAGAAGADRMVFFERDPDVVQLVIPAEFEMFEPQAESLNFVIPTRLVTAGVHIHRPGAIAYRDGI